MDELNKVCSKCGVIKELGEFSKDKSKKDGLLPDCKSCRKVYVQANKEAIAAYMTKYRESNKSTLSIKKAEYYKNNKEAISLKDVQYYKDNKEAIALRSAEYHQANKEAISIKHAEYVQANKELLAVKRSAYYKTPKGKASSKNAKHKRRALMKGGSVTTEQLQQLIAKSPKCFYCSCEISDDNRHIDHYIPLAKDGLHDIQNLVIACAPCNLKKSDKMPHVFFEQIGLDYTKVYEEDFLDW